MDKQLICAVAGSGKTTLLLGAINADERYLIVTYTNENFRSIKASLIRKFGRVPENVYLVTYFSFLYAFCYRPFFSYLLRDKLYTWKLPPASLRLSKKSEIRHYITKGGYLYSNRVAKLVIEGEGVPKVIRRLEKYFDHFFIDEIQDFAANDFNLLMALAKADVNMLFVGDYFQHTFDTSRDGPTRKNLHKRGLAFYLNEFEKVGFDIDTTTLSKSYRCSPAVCRFISEHVGIPIESHREDRTSVVIVKDKNEALRLARDDEKIKLFYDSSTKYSCYSNNWGKCKGLNKYLDVCVVLNGKSARLFQEDRLGDLAENTRNKLYVACSRTRGDLFILDGAHIKSMKQS